MQINITIPDILFKKFKVGTQEDREAIADYICDYICDAIYEIYEILYEEVDNGKD